jgi:protein required for attachment to host cells
LQLPTADTKEVAVDMHWVVVADAARAVIFESGPLLDGFFRVHQLAHPETHAKAADLVSGDRGRTEANGRRAAFDRHTDPHRATVDAFAREVAGVLRDGRVTNQYERLVLVAPPTFLGLVRAHLDEQTARRVVHAIPHEWTDVADFDLPARVRGALPETAGMPPLG